MTDPSTPLDRLDADIAARKAHRIAKTRQHDRTLRWALLVSAAVAVVGLIVLLLGNQQDIDEDLGETLKTIGSLGLIAGGGAAIAARATLKDNATTRADIGRGTEGAQRFECSYLGGHMAYPDPIDRCRLMFTYREVAIEATDGRLLARYDLDDVVRIRVETAEEATRRVTATRVLAFGVFALAVKKSKPGSVLVSLETKDGDMAFERAKSDALAVRRELARPIASVSGR